MVSPRRLFLSCSDKLLILEIAHSRSLSPSPLPPHLLVLPPFSLDSSVQFLVHWLIQPPCLKPTQSQAHVECSVEFYYLVISN